MPEDWKMTMVCPIHKKRYRKDFNNYHGIALLNVAYKILTRIKGTAEYIIGEYQGRFRPDKLITDQLFIVRQLLQKTLNFTLISRKLMAVYTEMV